MELYLKSITEKLDMVGIECFFTFLLKVHFYSETPLKNITKSKNKMTIGAKNFRVGGYRVGSVGSP